VTYANPSSESSTAATSTTTSQRPREITVRKSTETKAAFKTTEFIAYLGCVVAIAVMSLVVGDDTNAGGSGGEDYFLADKAMLLITIVTVGYLLSRGLAKSGSREPYDDTIDLARR
jgi:hypothetical protein